LAALYAIRAMRLHGHDAARFALVEAVLRNHGYEHEAEAINASTGRIPIATNAVCG